MQVTAQVAYPFGHNENTTVHPDRRFASQSTPTFPAIQLRQETCINVWGQCGVIAMSGKELATGHPPGHSRLIRNQYNNTYK
jgi:hypothetical protein